MPETRGRGFWSQMNVGGDRTRRGGESGAGLVPEFSRLVSAQRDRKVQSSTTPTDEGTLVIETQSGTFAEEPRLIPGFPSPVIGDRYGFRFTFPPNTLSKFGAVYAEVGPSDGPGSFVEFNPSGGRSRYFIAPTTLGGGAGEWPFLFAPGEVAFFVRHEGATAGNASVTVAYFVS